MENNFLSNNGHVSFLNIGETIKQEELEQDVQLDVNISSVDHALNTSSHVASLISPNDQSYEHLPIAPLSDEELLKYLKCEDSSSGIFNDSFGERISSVFDFEDTKDDIKPSILFTVIKIEDNASTCIEVKDEHSDNVELVNALQRPNFVKQEEESILIKQEATLNIKDENLSKENQFLMSQINSESDLSISTVDYKPDLPLQVSKAGCDSNARYNHSSNQCQSPSHRCFTKCEICGKLSPTMEQHQLHENKHRLHWCDHPNCSFSSQYVGALNRHKAAVHGLSKKVKLICPIGKCKATFESSLNMNAHLSIHRKPFFCRWPSCTYTAQASNHILVHVVGTHFKLSRHFANDSRFSKYVGKFKLV